MWVTGVSLVSFTHFLSCFFSNTVQLENEVSEGNNIFLYAGASSSGVGVIVVLVVVAVAIVCRKSKRQKRR